MSARGSFQTDERRPLAIVDTDTTDYYDDEVGGIPPPHRLSGLYNAGGYSPSASGFNLASSPFQASNSIHSGIRPLSGDVSESHSDMASSNNFAAAGIYSHAHAPMPTSGSMGSYGEKSAYNLHDDGARDDDAFLGGDMAERGGMSSAVAARERYMARKEAESSPFGYGAGAVGGANGSSAESRGCFSGKRKWAWIVGAIALVAVIAGVAAGVAASKSSSGSKASGVVHSADNDPSNFDKDPRLKRSFYGMCYTPLNSQYPQCGDGLDAVIEDVQLMSQLTSRIRLYGADCNVPSLVLEAIQKTKVNMTVFLAAWVPQPADDPDNTTWERQMSEVVKAVQKYGADHVDGVTVGNEYLLNNGPEGPLLDKMVQMRDQLKALNLPKTIPVGTADAGSMITTSLAEGSDYVMANVHAWFGGVPVDQAAGWVYSYTSNQEPSSALQASNKPTLYIAETGWPTNANDTASMTYQGAVAGVPELNEYLSTYICQANANITSGGAAADSSRYFHFELMDEPWKAVYGGVEPYWGLFNADKTFKDGLVIPDCPAP